MVIRILIFFAYELPVLDFWYILVLLTKPAGVELGKVLAD
jgi:hypothetical protein